MQKLFKLIRLPVSLPAALLFLVACGPNETAVQKANREGVMLIANGAEPPDLDPHTITGGPEITISEALFEGLTRYDPRDLSALPGVAERWEVSADGLVYTFHLRDNAKWSNGEPVTAEHFHSSVKRILTASLASENVEEVYYLAGAEDYHKGVVADFDKVGIKILGPRRLEYRLKAPLPFFVQITPPGRGIPFRSNWWNSLGEWIERERTGPGRKTSSGTVRS